MEVGRTCTLGVHSRVQPTLSAHEENMQSQHKNIHLGIHYPFILLGLEIMSRIRRNLLSLSPSNQPTNELLFLSNFLSFSLSIVQGRDKGEFVRKRRKERKEGRK